MLCSKGSTTTRNEAFSSEKTDISKCVPFYARGWSYVNESERKYLNSNLNFNRHDRAIDIRMLGYTDPYRIEDKTKALCYVKNSYVVESDIYSKTFSDTTVTFKFSPIPKIISSIQIPIRENLLRILKKMNESKRSFRMNTTLTLVLLLILA